MPYTPNNTLGARKPESHTFRKYTCRSSYLSDRYPASIFKVLSIFRLLGQQKLVYDWEFSLVLTYYSSAVSLNKCASVHPRPHFHFQIHS